MGLLRQNSPESAARPARARPLGGAAAATPAWSRDLLADADDPRAGAARRPGRGPRGGRPRAAVAAAPQAGDSTGWGSSSASTPTTPHTSPWSRPSPRRITNGGRLPRRGGGRAAYPAAGRCPPRGARRHALHDCPRAGQLAPRPTRTAPAAAPRPSRSRAAGCAVAPRGQRALPAHRRRRDHVGRRRRTTGSCWPGAPAGARDGSRVLAGFLEPGESLPGGGRPGGPRGGGPGGHRRGVPRRPAVAVPDLAHGGVHRAGHERRAACCRSPRSPRRGGSRREELWRPSPTGRLAMSGRLSISRRLLEHWLGHELDRRAALTRRDSASRPDPDGWGG